MQRKVFVSGIAALLVALLAGCTGGSNDGGSTDNSNPGDAGTATAAAQPGKYRTLPEPCSAVDEDTLDTLLPGIQQITDAEQRQKAYEGDATLTYDTDRKVGCRWKVESAEATDHLLVDFERVVSYDNAVSDDNEAQVVFAERLTAADLPEPASSSPTSSPTSNPSSSAPSTSSADPGSSPSASASVSASGSASGSASPSVAPSDLQPRTLTDLGDEAFLDDALSGSGSTAQQRTVTVAFRTSNVIVTIQYEEQPATVGVAPDSKEMQDRARKLAAQLSDTLGGQ
ncbi:MULTISPECIES: DUF3558 domain-containing protein [unclassified Streptomyces]|uniref:DUF3558 domain-containing protein n=1 Tax=unclassified Streptomyces TaxID=2593676 RepID=UPI00224D2B6A|nr:MULTISPECIES: DUF3558 domain-containing protein [unclassified Streptomyces]MCX5050152.1 DUF3558 domain-containing protein [Streptomyces sp. NBC_00474]MCX5060545.1 DUF3558 domain-containing protein [Streptomyces sp. NBC_00452]MCX5293863.1 DUF3558 domain-containing protein [Streptomyces sp. NBC_00183]